ncbi:Flp pilus assembly complex ATPase component TadA [Candidatus Woesearchaeota archaeon]|nr:Flp pilus assembly complex ATPase component TadA [Candidatus Woesearchaeota archaeon]
MKVKEAKIKDKVERLVVDTSVLIEGVVSKKIEAKEISPETIFIHEAVIAELEGQANAGKEKGYLGLNEIKKLRELSKKFEFQIIYSGRRQNESEIRFAKSGAIDAMIRELAYTEDAHFITADRVNALSAEAKGIKTILVEFEKEIKEMMFEKYFDATTMSLHLKENTKPVAKKGKPGEWQLVEVDEIMPGRAVRAIAKEIMEEAYKREDSSIEVERKSSTIIQLGRYRTVIVEPPFADGWEITLVRPVKKLSLEDYNLSSKLKTRLNGKAEGVLIAGAPGMGKSTFTQALTDFYSKQNKIIKTVEAPRDLVVPDTVTQYAIGLGSPEEIHDILLLSRPDYTIFDEMRNKPDFDLFADLRLAGVGMVGVIHATKPIDAIQRFIGKIEMGVIPHVVDTVIFIKNGQVEKTFSVKMEVKVPAGMTEEDLSRPCVVINDFETDKQEYELYSYGNDTVVVPVNELKKKGSAVQELAKLAIEHELRRYADEVEVEVTSDNKCTIYVPERDIAGIIGKEGKNIQMLEKVLGIGIDVQELKGQRKPKVAGEPVQFKAEMTHKNIVLKVADIFYGKGVFIYVDDKLLMTANVGKGGEIRINAEHKFGKTLKYALSSNGNVEVRI